MNPNKKKQLSQRRNSLQEELRKRELKARIQDSINYLEKNGFEYAIHYENEFLIWLQQAFSFRKKDGYAGLHDYQIDVHETDKNCSVFHFSSENEMYKVVKTELSHKLSKEKNVVICKNGGDPELEVSVETFLMNLALFMNEAEIWIVAKDKSFVLEYISEHRVIRFITP